jgi:hypothetical protein
MRRVAKGRKVVYAVHSKLDGGGEIGSRSLLCEFAKAVHRM